MFLLCWHSCFGWMTNTLCISRWWFQIIFIFTPIWGNDPIWLILFKWVETTNQFVYLCFTLSLQSCIQTTGVSRPWVELKNTKVPVLVDSKVEVWMKWNGMEWDEILLEWLIEWIHECDDDDDDDDDDVTLFRNEMIPWYILFIAYQIFDCINPLFWKIQLDS